MTNRQPVTEAGRTLLTSFFEDVGMPLDPAAAILAIEAQASQLSEAKAAELIEALPQRWREECDAIRGSALGEPQSKLARIAGIQTCIKDLLRALAATDATAPDAEREE